MTDKTAPFADPFEKMGKWVKDAEAKEMNDPTAMALATATPEGFPSVRMVLMRGCDERGVVFYTNFESRKGQELLENPNAALLFHWKTLRRQIRIEGEIEKVSDAEADAYFSGRARTSRIGAWASKQSRPMKGRFEFEAEIAKYTAKFGTGEVPRPDFWSGFRVKPRYFEFWRDRRYRLHERITYTLLEDGAGWNVGEIYP